MIQWKITLRLNIAKLAFIQFASGSIVRKYNCCVSNDII